MIKTIPILLKEQKVLLIGAGKVALQKAQVLADNNIDFKIIANEIQKDIYDYCKNIEKKKFTSKDIKDNHIVIDATGNLKVTKKTLAL